MLSFSEWLALGQFVLTAVAVWLVWLWRRDTTRLQAQIDALHRRVSTASDLTHKLANNVQGMPANVLEQLEEVSRREEAIEAAVALDRRIGFTPKPAKADTVAPLRIIC